MCIYIYIYIYMTNGALFRVVHFVGCSFCRRLAGWRGFYFPSRRFRDADVICMYFLKLVIRLTEHEVGRGTHPYLTPLL